MLGISIGFNAVSSHGTCTAVFVAVAAVIGFGLSSIQTLGKTPLQRAILRLLLLLRYNDCISTTVKKAATMFQVRMLPTGSVLLADEISPDPCVYSA